MAYELSPPEILEQAAIKGEAKARMSVPRLLLLAFLGGMYIALGFLAYLRIAGAMPAEWGSLPGLLGACVFPVGLMAVVLAGGELITGNMLVVATAFFARKITLGGLLRNWGLVTLGNLMGAVATAFFLGHLTGLTEGAVAAKVIAVALAKVADGPVAAFFSGIGCNLFVGLGVWLAYGAKGFAGKILAIWFPVMAFVAIGFQHVVANMFVIPAAMLAGAPGLGLADFAGNLIIVWLGNMVGGAIVLGLGYHLAYKKEG